MSSWNMGYHTDVPYSFGYFRDLNPLYVKYQFTLSGLAFPDFKNGNACELGFGQGISINMHAATSTTQWYGTDFNPLQVNFARQIASLSQTPVHLLDNSFEQLANRDDLPMFDFIGLHGIWSWINRENQGYIVDFIRDHLNIGGVVYVSYNVSPGFLAFEPVRYLMKTYNDRMVSPSASPKEHVDAINTFLDDLLKVQPATVVSTNYLEPRIQSLKNHEPNYIFAEYLNDDWDIIHFQDLANTLDRAKVEFALNTTTPEYMDMLNFTTEQLEFLKRFKGTPMYEASRDFITMQQFRRDYFVKGKRILTAKQFKQEVANMCFVQIKDFEGFSFKAQGRVGEANLSKELYEPVMKVFADHKPHTVAEIYKIVTQNGKNTQTAPNGQPLFTDSSIVEVINVLTCYLYLAPAIPLNELTTPVVEHSLRLNNQLLADHDLMKLHYLASPVIQGAVSIDDLTRRLLALRQRMPELNEQVFMSKYFKTFTAGLDDQKNEKGESNKDIFAKQINFFFNKHLPMLESLLVV